MIIRIRNALITGLLVTAPIILTLDIFIWFVRSIDDTARQYFTFFLPFDFPGLGLVLGLVLILFIGFLAQNYVGNWIVSHLDTMVRRVPLGGGVYSAIKKFLSTVLNPRNDKFKGVVLVEFPRKGLYSIGFRTGHPDPKVVQRLEAGLVNVFVPCTPNPTSGFYLLVPEKELVVLDLSVQEAFKIVISMGIVTSDESENS